MPNTIIVHPATGLASYGTIKEYSARGILIPGGEIRLQRGKYNGPNRAGFGVRHIWERHQQEVIAAGFPKEEDVCRYVASIVRSGSPVNYEGGSWSKTRVMVVRTRAGMAVLEFKDQRGDAFWTVITAYSANKNHGTRIGTVV